MSITSHVIDSSDLTVFTVVGEMTFNDQIGVLRGFYEGSPTANVIWDMRKLEGNRASKEELQDIVAFVKKNATGRTGGKTALVTGSELDFGIARMMEAYAFIRELSWQTQPFRSMADAFQWINEDRS
jgi:hypothetical protein